MTVKNLPESPVYLGYHYGNKTFLLDTAYLDEKGKGAFTGEEKLTGGIYFIAFPSMNYVDFIINDLQNFSVETDTIDFLKTLNISNSLENALFIDYQIKMSALRNRQSELIAHMNMNTHIPDSVVRIRKELDKLTAAMNSYKKDMVKSNPNTLFGKIIDAFTEPEVPEPDYEKLFANGGDRDSIIQMYMFNWYKNHYFDNYDFSDNRLLRTSILPARLKGYFSGVVYQDADSMTSEAHRIIGLSMANDEVYRFTLSYIFSFFEMNGEIPVEKAFVSLAEKYYLSGKTPWLSEEFLKQLRTRVECIKPNMTGVKAPDMLLYDLENRKLSLHSLNDEFILLYFYDIECGHCKELTPLVHDLAKKYDNRVRFLAIYDEIDFEGWKKFISDNNLTDWTNLCDADSSTGMVRLYDIYKTPRIFLLDHNKTIIAKDMEVEQLESYLDYIISNQ
ncbi:MAG: thioredoxin-like domain-containing protein [Bacteroidota bacterium]